MSDCAVPTAGPCDPRVRRTAARGRLGASTWRGVLLAALVGLSSAACHGTPEKSVNSLVFLTRDGCINTVKMRARLDQALRALDVGMEYRVIDVSTLPADDNRTGYGTPTVLYAGRDLFGMPQPAGSATPT